MDCIIWFHYHLSLSVGESAQASDGNSGQPRVQPFQALIQVTTSASKGEKDQEESESLKYGVFYR